MSHRLASLALRDRAIYAKRDGRPAIVHAKDNYSRLYVAGTVDVEGTFRAHGMSRSAIVAVSIRAFGVVTPRAMLATLNAEGFRSQFPVSPIFAH